MTASGDRLNSDTLPRRRARDRKPPVYMRGQDTVLGDGDVVQVHEPDHRVTILVTGEGGHPPLSGQTLRGRIGSVRSVQDGPLETDPLAPSLPGCPRPIPPEEPADEPEPMRDRIRRLAERDRAALDALAEYDRG